MDHVGEIVPTEEEPGGRWSTQASGELLRAQLRGEQRRLPPVVGLALEPDRPPLDLRRARATRREVAQRRPSSRRRSPGRPTARRGDRAARARRTASSRAAGIEGPSGSGWPRPCSAARALRAALRPRSRVTPIAVAMWSAASSSNPLTNVASQSNSRCSSSSSNRYDHSIVARRVPCRSSRPRRTEPPSVDALVERAEHTVHPERRRSSRRQLDRERQARRGGRRGARWSARSHPAEIGPGGGRPLPEEVDGTGGPVERAHGHDVLAVDGERLTARRQHVQLRTAPGEGVDDAAAPSTTCSQLSITRSVR